MSVANFKLGRRPPKNAPAILLSSILTGKAPDHPITADHFGAVDFELYENNRYGVCGPAAVGNHLIMVSSALLGTAIRPTLDDIFNLYRRSGNPNFDPVTGEDDNGVDMQTMLEALLHDGIGDGRGSVIKPVAFARVDILSDAELTAAASIFGTLWGVNLLVAQQSQTDSNPPRWDYVRSPEWGGHAIMNGAYELQRLEDVISWDIRVQTTDMFRRHQLEEAWVIIWPFMIDHPAFQAGVDLDALRKAYEGVTGRVLDVPTPPQPPTNGSTVDQADRELFAAMQQWAQAKGLT